MKKMFATIYSVYVGLVFLLCMIVLLVLFVPLLVIRDDRRRMNIVFLLNRIWLRWIWSSLTGIRVKVEGREKIHENVTYAFVCNHTNMLDIPFTAAYIDHYYKPLVKKELMNYPIIGLLLRMTSLGVDRHNAESRHQAAIKMVEALKSGLSLLVFPEGTRNRTAEPTKEFFDGVFKAAVAAQVAIAPFVFINSRQLQPVKTILVYPGTVMMRFLDPIPTAGMTEADVAGLKNKVRKLISDVLIKEDVNFKVVGGDADQG